MSGPQFFQTRMGHTFYEGTMPALVKQLERLNNNLEEMTADHPIPYKVTDLPTAGRKGPFKINEAGDVELPLSDEHCLIIHRADEGLVMDVWFKGEDDGSIWSTYFFADEMMQQGGPPMIYLWCRLLREVREMLPGGALMELVDEMPGVEDLSQLENIFDRAAKLAYERENREADDADVE